MKNQIVASFAAIPFLIAGANAANAAVIQFDDKSISGGTISYDGEGGSLIGTDLLLDMVRTYALTIDIGCWCVTLPLTHPTNSVYA
ncbi:MAG: hypothetical protein F6K39_26090 [Okeania sp. SIO3B3]|nr:hypothetical protein [Okeania sp. SIO3B3]